MFTFNTTSAILSIALGQSGLKDTQVVMSYLPFP